MSRVLRGDQVATLDGICPAQSCKESDRARVQDEVAKGKLYTALSLAIGGLGVVAIAGGIFLIVPRTDGRRAGVDVVARF